MKTFADKVLAFYSRLSPPAELPANILALFPFTSPDVRKVMKEFYHKYFADNHPRHMLIGINPGRFGAGITGINFTAPGSLLKIAALNTALETSQSYRPNLFIR